MVCPSTLDSFSNYFIFSLSSWCSISDLFTLECSWMCSYWNAAGFVHTGMQLVTRADSDVKLLMSYSPSCDCTTTDLMWEIRYFYTARQVRLQVGVEKHVNIRSIRSLCLLFLGKNSCERFGSEKPVHISCHFSPLNYSLSCFPPCMFGETGMCGILQGEKQLWGGAKFL